MLVPEVENALNKQLNAEIYSSYLYVSMAAQPEPVRERLTLENDNRSYTPRDLFPVCRQLKTHMVYDLHHHRCLGDGLSKEIDSYGNL